MKWGAGSPDISNEARESRVTIIKDTNNRRLSHITNVDAQQSLSYRITLIVLRKTCFSGIMSEYSVERSYSSTELRIRKDLGSCLKYIHPFGTFALYENYSDAPNPGISLKHGGTIGLPLSDRDAEALVAASHQAPFGMGQQTIVDTTVRQTWELSAADFELKNPAWQGFLDKLICKVATGLGVNTTGQGVSAQLYKMLLYDEGAMFKPHQE